MMDEAKPHEAYVEMERLIEHEVHRGRLPRELGREALLDLDDWLEDRHGEATETEDAS